MLTPQQIQDISFEKALFGGYDMDSVDDILEPLTEDYVTLYKENSVLKSKMRILVEKLEEYRKQEATMQNAMVAGPADGGPGRAGCRAQGRRADERGREKRAAYRCHGRPHAGDRPGDGAPEQGQGKLPAALSPPWSRISSITRSFSTSSR